MNVEKVLLTLSSGPDRRTFRVASLLLAVAIWSTDKLLGGSWRSFLVATLLLTLMSFFLPVELPQNPIRLKILWALKSFRRTAFGYQFVIGLIASSVTTIYAVNVSGDIGRQFNVGLLSVVLCAFFFELRVSILTWVANAILVHFYVIRPSYSFYISTSTDFAQLILYWYLGLGALAIPTLIRATSCRLSRGG
jgi:hypothetical protein